MAIKRLCDSWQRQLWLRKWEFFAEIIPQQLTAEWLFSRSFIAFIIEQLFYNVKNLFCEAVHIRFYD